MYLGGNMSWFSNTIVLNTPSERLGMSPPK